jgi:hypothetical protein
MFQFNRCAVETISRISEGRKQHDEPVSTTLFSLTPGQRLASGRRELCVAGAGAASSSIPLYVVYNRPHHACRLSLSGRSDKTQPRRSLAGGVASFWLQGLHLWWLMCYTCTEYSGPTSISPVAALSLHNNAALRTDHLGRLHSQPWSLYLHPLHPSPCNPADVERRRRRSGEGLS